MKQCLAKTRKGTPCQRYPLKQTNNGRCRFHGGLSTGAKTKEGKQRQLEANLKHGYYAKQAIKERKKLKDALKDANNFIKSLNKK